MRRKRGLSICCVRFLPLPSFALALPSYQALPLTLHAPLLVRRQLLRTYNPSTGQREPARNFKEYEELQRRKAAGEPLTQVLQGGGGGAGEGVMLDEGGGEGYGGSEMGDE